MSATDNKPYTREHLERVCEVLGLDITELVSITITSDKITVVSYIDRDMINKNDIVEYPRLTVSYRVELR